MNRELHKPNQPDGSARGVPPRTAPHRWSIYAVPGMVHFPKPGYPTLRPLSEAEHLKERKPSMRSRSIGLYIVVSFASV